MIYSDVVFPWHPSTCRTTGRTDPSPRWLRVAGRSGQRDRQPAADQRWVSGKPRDRDAGLCPTAEQGLVFAIQPSLSCTTCHSWVLRSLRSAGSSNNPLGLKITCSHPGLCPLFPLPAGNGSDPCSVAVTAAQSAPTPPFPHTQYFCTLTNSGTGCTKASFSGKRLKTPNQPQIRSLLPK